jgi:putative lipoprotein
MPIKKILLLLLIIISLLLTGCDTASHKSAVTGIIDHSHRMFLPAGTVVSVLLMDTTKSGSPGKKIAEEVIKSEGDEIPMPFVVIYDPGRINEEHSYSITVKIQDDLGNLLYTNNDSIPVITQGNPTQHIDVPVVLADG